MRERLRTRPIFLFSALLAAMLVLSSCVSMELESEFDEDGGAVHTMALTVDMGDLGQLGDLGDAEIDPFENIDEIEEAAGEQGMRVERIEDGDILGVRLVYEVDDSSDLGQQLNDMFNAGASPGEEVSPFSGTFEKDRRDYTLDLTVDGAALTNTAGGEDLEGAEDFGLGLDTIFEFTYTARLPGELDEEATNGRVGSDGTVTWDLPLDTTETLTAKSSTGGDSSNLLLILVVIGILVLGLIALGAVGFFIFMNRRGSSPAPETAAAGTAVDPQPGAGVAPPPSYGADQPTQPSLPPVQETAEEEGDKAPPEQS